MLSSILWGALSTISFALFFVLPSGPGGTSYTVLVPGFIALTASILQATQYRQHVPQKLAALPSSDSDDALIARTEKLKNAKWKEQDSMLRHQSSRRRAARR